MNSTSDCPPGEGRKGLLSLTMVLLCVTFFTGTMFAGGKLAGLAAYAVGAVAAYSSPWVAPLVGIAAFAASYWMMLHLSGQRPPHLQEEL